VQVCTGLDADKTDEAAIRTLLTSPPRQISPMDPAALKRRLDNANTSNAELMANIVALQHEVAAAQEKAEASLLKAIVDAFNRGISAAYSAAIAERDTAIAGRDTAIAERDAARKTAAGQAAAIAGLRDRVRELEAAAAAAPRGGAGAIAVIDHAACYTVGPVLGRGSFGVVHRAVTTPAAAAAGMKAGVDVAIKIMAAPTGEEEAHKLQREMATLQKVRRSNRVDADTTRPHISPPLPLSTSRRFAATRTSWRCWTTGATLAHAT